MVQINFANKEIQCKIVYYGPGMSGKTTNLEVVHKKAPVNAKGDLTSIATEGDRTLFFDFMPLDLGNIAGIKTKFQLYTVPGQVYYNSTRKLVLQGVDGIVFVADSQADKIEENLEAIENLRTNLKEYGRDIESIPIVFQWNKRDLPTALTVEELNRRLNPLGAPVFEAVASTGEGVFPTLKALASLVLESINRDKKDSGIGQPAASRAVPRAAAPAAPAAPRRVGAPQPPPAAAPVQSAPAAAAPSRLPAQPATRTTVPVRPPAPPAPVHAPTAAETATMARPRPVAAPPKAEPVGRPSASKPVGRVQIKERTDKTRILATIVIAAVILGAVGFLILKYL